MPESAIRPGKLVIDVESQTYQFSDLSADDKAAMAADIAARVAGLRRRWEESGDLEALFGALIFHQLHLPEWLFKGLIQNREQRLYKPDAIRFLAVRDAHDVRRMTMDQAYDWAAEAITDARAKGGRDTMMKSYQKMRRKVAKIDRIQQRPRARRRRR